MSIQLHRYLVKYGPGGVISLTHIKCTYVLGLLPFCSVDLYIDTFHMTVTITITITNNLFRHMVQ